MPALGADMDEGTLLEWLVKPGDEVHRGDIIAVVDTAKSAIDVETFHSGTIGQLVVQPGETVPVGTVLATLTSAAAEPAPAGAPARKAGRPAARPAAARPAKPAATRPAGRTGAAGSPLVRQLAQELGIDLGTVQGTGRAGAITRSDVEKAAASRRGRATPLARRIAAELDVDLAAVTGTGPGGAVREDDVRRAAREISEPHRAGLKAPPSPAAPAPPQAAAAPVAEGAAGTAGGPAGPVRGPAPATREERARAMRLATARLMARSKREIPHYYVSNTVDMAGALTWLRDRNRALEMSDRLVPAALLLKAAAVAVRQVPELNGFWADDHFTAADAVHLGVAISLRGGGLVTPAIHDAADLPVGELMARLRDLVSRARGGRLRSSELTDATITVTNLGDQGVESVLGVIYPPQVALVGFGKIVERPWAVGGLLGVRPVANTTLAADHRATDGYTGARYLAALADLLQRPEEM